MHQCRLDIASDRGRLQMYTTTVTGMIRAGEGGEILLTLLTLLTSQSVIEIRRPHAATGTVSPLK